MAARLDSDVVQLDSRLLGYWKADVAKTVTLAKEDNRELDPGEEILLSQFTYEYRRGRMVLHGLGRSQPHSYIVKNRDSTTGRLTLSLTGGGMTKDADLILKGNHLIQKSDGMSVALSRMEIDEARKRLGKNKLLREVPVVESFEEEADAADHGKKIRWQKNAAKSTIPDKRAQGIVNGVVFKIQKATLQRNTLFLRQGEGFFADQEFQINLTKKFAKPYDGKSILVEPGAGIGGTSIWIKDKEGGADLSKTKMIHEGVTMQLIFGRSQNNTIPGKIYLCLPDKKSFVAGTFEAELK